MEFELKFYKLLKNKQYLINNELFFIYSGNNSNKKNWILIEQALNKLNLKYYKIYNKLMIKNLSNSIYITLKHLIHGNIIFIKQRSKENLKLKNLVKLYSKLTLLCVKLNKNIYSITQVKNIDSLNYGLTLFLLFKSFKNYFKNLSK